LGELQQVDIIEKVSVEATKGDQAVGHVDASAPSAGFGHWLVEVDLVPPFLVQVEAVDVTHVEVVPASDYQ
jgi:hypothetical protein